ncbi:hypothetical protein FRC01_002813 [Tulasnella sp. 417]|nr:hypothetical protein FRC01_002813 [Tulasnella sp. 417]
MPVDFNPSPTALPLVRVFKIDGPLHLVETILRHIQIPTDLDELLIAPIPCDSPAHSSLFWMKTLSPLLPALQRMHMKKGGSRILFRESGHCAWFAEGVIDSGFDLIIDGLPHTATLEWIASIVKSWEYPGDFPGFTSWTTSTLIGVPSAFRALQTIQRITSIDILVDLENFDLSAFWKALGGATHHATTSPPAFPFLQYLRIRKWRFGLARVIKLMKQRYASGQPVGWRPHSNIRLDFNTHRPVFFEDRKRPQLIIHMDKVTELRELDGVDSVRIGCPNEQPGMLAVVWNEQNSRATWG